MEEALESLSINTDALNSEESSLQDETAPEIVPDSEDKAPIQENSAVETEVPVTLEESDEEVELFTYFTTKETMRIIAVVFGNDSVDFVNTIEKIADCPNLEQAALILQSVFSSYHINPLQSREGRFLEERVKQYFIEKRD